MVRKQTARENDEEDEVSNAAPEDPRPHPRQGRKRQWRVVGPAVTVVEVDARSKEGIAPRWMLNRSI
jgi:hypothetical protein